MKRDYEIPYIENLNGDEEQVVIIAHGFGSSMQSPTAQMALENLPKIGIGTIAFDFPAHGASPVNGDVLSVDNCIADLEAVEAYVREKCPKAEVSYFGSSFGAYITLLYLARNPQKKGKAFLRSAAVNMHVVFENPTEAEAFAMAQQGHLIINYGTPLKLTSKFVEDLKAHDLFELYKPGEAEVMMIHGACDETIEYEKAVSFAEKFDITIITVEGGDHRLSQDGMPEAVIMMAMDFYMNK
ncbi:MAG: alpha/beta fold hydrolase [Firmicutes bacterium]|nr:alpha/beta fold hydrolase [Bacillota bacterium]